LLLCLIYALERFCRTGWGCTLAALGLMVLSYPLLICLDRGNIEIVVVTLVASSILLMARGRHWLAALCLAPAISLKFYPAFLLVLMVRQRRYAAVLLALGLSVVITGLSLHGLSLSALDAWHYYHRNLVYHTRAGVLGNLMVEGAASPWNAFKIIVATAEHWGLIGPVELSFNGPFIQNAYFVYVILMAGMAAAVAVYTLVEREFLRTVIPLLLYLSINVPMGGDYRLLYGETAMIVLIALHTRRRFDLAAIALLAVTLVPKKEIILSYMGKTETEFADVTINAVINPVLILVVLALLLADGWAQFDPKWAWLRLQSLLRVLLPRGVRERKVATLPESVA
jgi:hypothetical protein